MRKLFAIVAMLTVGFAVTAIAGSDHYGGQKTLRANSMFDTNVAPQQALYKGSDPGDGKFLPRGFEGAPPQIPHTIEDMDVDINNNDCIGCHESGITEGGPATVPKSHVLNGEVNKARYQCVICHVPQADVQPLVKNENDMFVKPVKK